MQRITKTDRISVQNPSTVRHEFGRHITTKTARFDGNTVKMAALTKIDLC